tara:strand:+ start:90 stop:515 length:426 start_codon:yes stop_codon:yes gene_type:complete
MVKRFEQLSNKPSYMKHNGGLLFRPITKKKFEFKTKIKKSHLNKAGITHGGYICTIIDAGAGTAAHRSSGNRPCVTISLDVKFIAPSILGDELIGSVEIIKITKSMVFLDCKLKCKNKLISSAVGIWKILKRPLPNAGLGG